MLPFPQSIVLRLGKLSLFFLGKMQKLSSNFMKSKFKEIKLNSYIIIFKKKSSRFPLRDIAPRKYINSKFISSPAPNAEGGGLHILMRYKNKLRN